MQSAIVQHAVGAHEGYLKTPGASAPRLGDVGEADLDAAVHALLQATTAGLDAAERGELATAGPRGGRRWPARFFVRYAAWHVLDHAWEIEDRVGRGASWTAVGLRAPSPEGGQGATKRR